MKAAGSDTALPVPFAASQIMAAAFHDAHRRRFGFTADRPLVVEALTAEAIGATDADAAATVAAPSAGDVTPRAAAQLWLDGARRAAPVFDRDTLPAGWSADGPCLVIDATQTALVEPGWRVRVDEQANLILESLPLERGGAGVGVRAPAEQDERERRRALPHLSPNSPANTAIPTFPPSRGRKACPTPCGWSCSPTCSCRWRSRWARRCRTPPPRSTSRSGWTSPAPCSTAQAP